MKNKAAFYTVISAALLIIGLYFIFHDWRISMGVIIGAICSYLGLLMIIAYVQGITPDQQQKWPAMLSYLIRYLFYGSVFFFFAWLQIPPLAMLAGFACGKLALVLYSLQSRKEVENGNP